MTLKYKCNILTAAIITDAIIVITGIATLLISLFSIMINYYTVINSMASVGHSHVQPPHPLHLSRYSTVA
jgi:hypothetical protein